MRCKLTKDFVFVNTPYAHMEFVRDVLNGVWSAKEKMNRFPRNLHAMRELASYYPELGQNQIFVEAGKSLAEARQKYLALKAGQNVRAPRMNPRLRPYQCADVFYLEHLPAAGIFNEPRTGKTPTSIELIRQLKTKRNLVICPASLIWNWAAEFEEWWPECGVFVVHGDKKNRADVYRDWNNHFGKEVLIVSKNTWKLDYIDKTLECPLPGGFHFDTCFVDEAHYLRNYKTAQSKAVFAVHAKHRYALTGTPSTKHGKDVYGILHFLYPERFNSYWQFVERYWGTYQDEYGTRINEVVKPERRQEFEELIGFIAVQRKRKEVMQWLPDKERIKFRVQMGSKQRKLYDQMAETFVAMLDEIVDDGQEYRYGLNFVGNNPEGEVTLIDAQNVLTQLLRMRQICLDPALLGFKAPSAKTEAILEWLDNNREPVVIMSMFTSYLKLLKPQIEELGIKVGMLHGEMANHEKDTAARNFQAGRYDVLLCNIISAGVGFTLDRAETIIFTDKAWNSAENEQAEDRITPVTEERNHKHAIISMVCTHSVDYRIEELLEAKQSLTHIVNHGGREAIKKLLQG